MLHGDKYKNYIFIRFYLNLSKKNVKIQRKIYCVYLFTNERKT